MAMSACLSEQLGQDLECEGLLRCLHGLGELETECFTALVDAEEPLTVDQIADAIDRERSTAYRAVQRLLENGLIRKEQINYDQGGYCHVYKPTDPETIADEMQRLLNDWYAKMGPLIQEFKNKYERTSTQSIEL